MKTRVLTVCAVIFLFCGIVNAGINDGLVAYYPFNGNANDESGNGHNGIVNGAILTSDRFGNANNAYSFAGTDDDIDLTGTGSLDFLTGGFSLVAWANFTAENPDSSIVTKHYCGVHNSYFIGVNGNSLDFYVDTDPRLKTTEKYNDGKWHFVVGVYDGTTQYLYVDGLLKLSQARTYSIPNSSNIRIGGVANGTGDYCIALTHFVGAIDDVRIYNRAISASEVQQLYQGQSTCLGGVVKFTAGTPAKAAEVNANFDTLNCQIQVLNSQVQALQGLKAIVCQDHPTASVCQ